MVCCYKLTLFIDTSTSNHNRNHMHNCQRPTTHTINHTLFDKTYTLMYVSSFMICIEDTDTIHHDTLELSFRRLSCLRFDIIHRILHRNNALIYTCRQNAIFESKRTLSKNKSYFNAFTKAYRIIWFVKHSPFIHYALFWNLV